MEVIPQRVAISEGEKPYWRLSTVGAHAPTAKSPTVTAPTEKYIGASTERRRRICGIISLIEPLSRLLESLDCRPGSLIIDISATKRKPGTPTTTNTVFHGGRPARNGRGGKEPAFAPVNRRAPTMTAAPLPIVNPLCKVLKATPRRAGGKKSLIIDTAAGPSDASPIATAMR